MNPGIFDVIGTPQERQEKTLRRALELRVEHWEYDDYLYRSAGDLLLQHGKFYSGRELPEQYKPLKGVPGRCFMNALDACRADPTLRYVEGVYAIGDGHYTPHAWCLDPDGNLLEVSLSTDPEDIALGKRVGGRLDVLTLDHWGYWGAVFHPDLIQTITEEQDACGILDRPKADALDHNAGTMEWRDEWPILKVPYDPERRSL